MTHRYGVDVVLDTAEAARVLPQLHQLSAAGLSHPQFDQMPDAVTWWRVRPDAAQLAELAAWTCCLTGGSCPCVCLGIRRPWWSRRCK
jgi:hypothetical protein